MCIWYDILTEHPDGLYGKDGEDWDYGVLSRHICFDCIRDFKHKPWSSGQIALRDDLPFNDIFKNQFGEFVLDLGPGQMLTLDESFLGHNRNAPWDFVKKFEEEYNRNQYILAQNPNLPFEDLKGSSELDELISYGALSNKALTLNFVEENVNICIKSKSQMRDLSENPIVTKEFVLKYPGGLNGFPWNLPRLARHLPLDFITDSEIFSYKNMKFKLKNKIFCAILLNPSVSDGFLEPIEDYMSHEFSFFRSPTTTPENFIKYHGLNCKLTCYKCRSYVAKHENFPLDFFVKNPKLNGVFWDLKDICQNPNLTWDFVKDHIDGFLGQRWSSKALSYQRWVAHADEPRFKRQKAIL